jgi:recombination protein RecR
MLYPLSLEKLISTFKSFPGIGSQMAERLAFHVLKLDNEDVKSILDSIINGKLKLHFCSICGNLTENNICDICLDETRNKKIICVVENIPDVFIIERSREYKGLFHVLGGVISPLDSVTEKDLNINALLKRVEIEKIDEIIIATNPTVEGEATALYICKILSEFNIKITRIAKGIPIGSDLGYIDSLTLAKAIENRVELK